jgi:DNA-binding LacI/PurR family transcriptional regulator
MQESKNKNGSRKRLDIHDVARRARVSIATVSRTINGVTTVDKELARRVWKAIRELDYVPNPHARALISGHSRLLAVLVSEITNPFFPELIQGFEEVATAHGYEVLIVSTSGDAARMKECIRRILERNVEGAAVMTFGIEGPVLEELGKREIPMVFVDAAPENPNLHAIKVDYQRGIREGVQHLGVLGHRKIAFITGPAVQLSAQLRKEAFLQAARQIGCAPPDEWVIQGDHTLEGGMAAMEQLLLQPDRPTAVMCSNDMTAIGALRILARNGIVVPDEMSIIGFDDIHLAEFVHPPLTTVRMSRLDLARAAVDALRAHIGKQDGKTARAPEPVSTTLTVRESTAYPPKTSLATGKANGHSKDPVKAGPRVQEIGV